MAPGPAPSLCSRLIWHVPVMVAAFAGLLALEAQGAIATYRASLDGKPVDVTVAVVTRPTGNYVSLNSLCAQVGAACSVQPSRIQVDFKGKSCWVRVNDAQVNASLSRFSLDHAIVRDGDEALIAVADVTPFFSKAFQVNLEASGSPASGQPIADEPTPLEDIEIPTADRQGIQTIVIDPGHGGSDAGVAGQSLKEKDLALAFALALGKELETALKSNVIFTRTGDTAMDAAERIDKANRSEGDLLISVHAGASFSANASGFELFYSAPAGSLRVDTRGVADSRAAGLRRAATSKAIAESIFAAMQGASDSRARGVHEAPIRLLNGVSMPGILIEVGCLTNPGEEGLLDTEAYRSKLAKAIAAGIVAYAQGGAAR